MGKLACMVLENILGLTSEAELAREEERLSKLRAAELFDRNLLDQFEVGTFVGLASIHQYLFQDDYPFAGKVRHENIAKGSFRFVPVLYLEAALEQIDLLPYHSYDLAIAKYVEMNVAHPFREGNGRSMRIWLDSMLRREIGQVIDWSQVPKRDYLQAMERSPVNDLEIRTLLQNALTSEAADRTVYLKGIDTSYHYEGYDTFHIAPVAEE